MAGTVRIPTGRRWRRAGLLLGGATVLLVGAWFGRGLLDKRATAQPANPTPSTAAIETSDYVNRVVAYMHGSQPISRQELGEYLIVRYGAEKLPLLLNKQIVDEACRKQGVQVTAAEVEAALEEDMKNLAVDKSTFLKTVLARSKKNLYEWKEDILRPRLQLSRLVQARVQVTPEDLRRGFESAFGEKVECRVIIWSHDQEKQAVEEYGKLRESDEAFTQKAKTQQDPTLAATGGKIKPISRFSMTENVEREAFMLKPGQVSSLIRTREGIVLLRCDRRIPADTTVNMEAVRTRLEKEVREQKLQNEMASAFNALKEQARPQPLLKKSDRMPADPTPAPNQVVAWLHGNKGVTREELGEFLISRYGGEKLVFLVNRRIIDKECQERGISVTDADIDRAFQDDLKLFGCDQSVFEKNFLARWNKNLFEYREDIIRPRLLMLKLSEGRAKYTEEDVKKCFEAYYGERLDCRVIMWPRDQGRFALAEYAKIRDSEAEFSQKAKTQSSPTLAAQGGRIPVFGRHSLGDDNLEREAFKLQAGDMTTLMETPQGHVVIRCDRRIPPETGVTIDQVREKLVKEVMDKKVQQEMQVVFKQLRDKANPRLILKSVGETEDVATEAMQMLKELPPLGTKAPGER